jgi:aminoglycoside phosphotransferase
VTGDAEATLVAAGDQIGLATTGATPIRLGENTIFRLPGRVVARISQPGQQFAARREVAVSRWLNRSGVAAVAALPDIDQPVEVDGRSVTFWEELPDHRPGDLIQVATVLKQLHSLPVPSDVPLGRLDPFIRLSERIEAARTIPEDHRAWLWERLAQLKDQWAAVSSKLPMCVVHGDAWAGNVVATDDGRTVLLDLERCSTGPREWDLVSTAVKYVTYGQISQREFGRFSAAYGLDVTVWVGFVVFRDIRELRMACFVVQQAASNPKFEAEALLRVGCLMGRQGPRPWTWTPVG